MALDRRIVELYDEYTHKPLDRRVFFNRLMVLAGSTAAIERAPEGSRPDDYLNANIDAVEALSVLLDGLDA